jgi:hypothetical protein
MALFDTDRRLEPATVGGETPEESPARESTPRSRVRDAIGIARFDGDAIARIAGDSEALPYGVLVMVVGSLLSVLLAAFGPSHVPGGERPSFPVLALVAVPITLAWSAFSVAVMHGAAKLLFGGTGRYLSLLRVIWLGSIVQWLILVPFIGAFVAGIWSLLILLVAFDEVEGIARLEALVLVGVMAALMFVFSMMAS